MIRAGMGLAAALLVAAWGLASLREPAHARPTAVSVVPAKPAPTPAPRLGRLRIPRIGVDAPIDVVGLTPGGDLSTPTDVTHVGWYGGGSLPGAPGSAVIDGHLDWYSGPAVFADLGRLRVGDRLSVSYSDGHAAFFRVSGLATYPADQPQPQLFRTDGPPLLALITCAGPWDGAGYRDRLVVAARPVEADE